MSMIRGKVQVNEVPESSLMNVGGRTGLSLDAKGQLVDAAGHTVQTVNLSQALLSRKRAIAESSVTPQQEKSKK